MTEAAMNSRRVKQVLTEAFRHNNHGEKISVTGGRGTAYGWVHVNIDAPTPPTCLCREMFGEGMNREPGFCPSCKERREAVRERAEAAIRAAKRVKAIQLGTFTADDGYNTQLDELLLQVNLA